MFYLHAYLLNTSLKIIKFQFHLFMAIEGCMMKTGPASTIRHINIGQGGYQ
jgi:hypothetical protein